MIKLHKPTDPLRELIGEWVQYNSINYKVRLCNEKVCINRFGDPVELSVLNGWTYEGKLFPAKRKIPFRKRKKIKCRRRINE